MKRDERELTREIDALERIHRRLEALLRRTLAAPSYDADRAVAIARYQSLILDKLADCGGRSARGAGGFAAFESSLRELLSSLGIGG
ncbi:MAG: hypothetical protein ACTHMI_15065 [Mucilaginibacter sp.]